MDERELEMEEAEIDLAFLHKEAIPELAYKLTRLLRYQCQVIGILGLDIHVLEV